jgi:raffinose/stachyose/melibiose transport system permease protein
MTVLQSAPDAPSRPAVGPPAPPVRRRPAANGPAGARGKLPRRTVVELIVLLGPPVALFVGMVLVPMARAMYTSLFKWNGFTKLANAEFVGLDNYAKALGDSVFLGGIWHNIEFAIGSILIQFPISVGVALLLTGKIKGRTVLRVLVFVPYVLSESITGVIWITMLQPGSVVDSFLEAIGLGFTKQLWLADPKIVMATLFGVITWKYVGFGIILMMAGLQGIPEELKEAAVIDGAGAWQVFSRITLPLLAPTIRVWAFLSIIGSLQLFDMVWIMTFGGPAGASTTMATYVTDHGFRRYEYGFGSACAVVLFLVSLVFALVYQKFVLSRNLEGAITEKPGKAGKRAKGAES